LPAADPPAKRIGPLLRALRRTYPDAHCALRHDDALQLLVATILSAQCTDVRVNLVTPPLFAKYKSAADFAGADPGTFQSEIRSTGFFRSKAQRIRDAARLLVEKHGGKVPDTMEELLELPGVARKTANVVLGSWFRKATGVVVDTHVDRVSRRLKLTKEKTPEKIERDLMRLVPKEEWIDFSHRLIWHGRQICVARKPRCEICPLGDWCPSKGRV
jgi:endonuclease III